MKDCFDKDGKPINGVDGKGRPIIGLDDDRNPTVTNKDNEGRPIMGYDKDGNPVYSYDDLEDLFIPLQSYHLLESFLNLKIKMEIKF